MLGSSSVQNFYSTKEGYKQFYNFYLIATAKDADNKDSCSGDN